MADDGRLTVRMPDDYAQEIETVHARTGIPRARLLKWAWESIREKMLKLPAVDIAGSKDKPKGK